MAVASDNLVAAAAETEGACTVKFNADLSLVSTNAEWEHLVVDLSRNGTSSGHLHDETRPLASSKPLAAVFKTYHEAPVRVVLSKTRCSIGQVG